MLNLGGVAPSAPALSGTAALPAAKGGEADAGDGQFVEMLNKLARDAAMPPGDKVASKARVSKGLAVVAPASTPLPQADPLLQADPLPLTDLPPVAGLEATDAGALSAGQVATDEPTTATAAARRDKDAPVKKDAPVEHDLGAGATEIDNILATIAGTVTPPTMPQGAPPIAPHGRVVDVQVDPKTASASPDEASRHADARAGKRAGSPPPVRQGPAVFRGPAHSTAAQPAHLTAAQTEDGAAATGPGGDRADDLVATGAPAKGAVADAAAAVAASQQPEPGAARLGNDSKRERLADGRQHQSKSAAGAPINVDAAQDATLPPTPSVPGAGDATADTRQRGDNRGGTRSAPPPVSPLPASSFGTDVRLTIEPSPLARAAGGRTEGLAAGTMASAESGTIGSDVPRQIVQAIRLQWSQGVGTARVTLQPDYLGNLSIDIRVDHGAVTAVLDASNAAVRQWIEGHEPLLRQALVDQGLTLDRLVVNDEQPPPQMPGDEGRQQGQEQEQQQRRRRPRAAPADATFEVVM